MATLHPALDHRGNPVLLTSPSTASAAENWLSPDAVATAVPLSVLPARLSGVDFLPWSPPSGVEHWEPASSSAFVEPPFELMDGKAAAAGIAILEDDGRVWLVSPSNQFAGYVNSLPKGRVDPGGSLQATAIREAYEETGLLAEITGFLTDSVRSRTHTRFYLGRRIGGCPSRMGWESQAVHLAPFRQLSSMLVHENDRPVLAALLALERGN